MRHKRCCGSTGAFAIFFLAIGFSNNPLPFGLAWAQPASSGISSSASSKSALTDACNALMAAAIRKPYGLGWSTEPNGSSPQDPRIDLRPGTTPAAGLVLFRAGKILGDVKLIEAAIATAHGMALCQRETGKMPDTAVFARYPSPQDLTPGARDRASTAAALGFFTEVLSGSTEEDPRIKSAAVRCMTWLTEQQLRDGSWPTEILLDDPNHPTRIFRLDSPDWRNCTMALLLIGDVLDRPTATHQGQAACNALIKLQINDAKAVWAGGAWAPIYKINGAPLKEESPVPYQLDTVATMRAAQTLLARYDLSQDPASSDALEKFSSTMKPLRNSSGSWYRVYALPTTPLRTATRPAGAASTTRNSPPAAPRSTAAAAPATMPGDSSGIAPQGMAELLSEIDKIRSVPATRVPHTILQQQIAATVTGLTDTPFAPPAEREHGAEDWQGSWLHLQTQAIYDLLQQMVGSRGN
jgi:hypothetical protein